MLTDRILRAAPGSNFGAMLQNYFRSGWAFLIPYLAAYLLYAWLKWPVNPVAAGSSPVDGGQLAVSAIGALPSTVTPSTAHSLLSTGVPCLLHVYWVLHAIHLVLGAIALRAWWRESGATVTGATDDSENTANRAAQPLLSTVPQSGHRLPLPGDWPGQTPGWQQPATAIKRPPSAMDRLWAAMPWLLLALLFYIPGVYLEWPSDPWEHLRRINEWRVLDTVTAHSAWMKSSYLIPYSLLSWVTGLRQIFWLDFYYTGICLLLCWQYYRLARACDLSEQASMMFVLLQALLFGNNIFSFYRYYGISSSIYAQIGAVALIRIAIESTKNGELANYSLLSLKTYQSCSNAPFKRVTCSTFIGLTRKGRVLPSLVCLCLIIKYNHAQGFGIAALGLAAIAIQNLFKLKRGIIWETAITLILLSFATIKWYPSNPAVDLVYIKSGWMSAWYGFNILSMGSPASEQMLKIIDFVGIINLFISIILVRNNNIIGWLTLTPIFFLCLPCVAIPYANAIIRHGGTDAIVAMNRMFFAIPAGLAVISMISNKSFHLFTNLRAAFNFKVIIILAGIIILLSTNSDKLIIHRFWHAIENTPDDLKMIHLIAEADTIKLNDKLDILQPPISTRDVSYMVSTVTTWRAKQISRKTESAIDESVYNLTDQIKSKGYNLIHSTDKTLCIMSSMAFYSPTSHAGVLSKHWNSSQGILTSAAEKELKQIAAQNRYIILKDTKHFYFIYK